MEIQTQSTFGPNRGGEEIKALPQEPFRAAIDCHHSPLYYIRTEDKLPLLCGLCFFREGWNSELPDRLHAYRTLARNGNPETSPKFMAHLHLIMGLKPPKFGEDLYDYRKRRSSHTRVQYTERLPRGGIIAQSNREDFTKAAWGIFPVASSLWELMGYQPPLGIVLVRAVAGWTESQIAQELEVSTFNIHIRMAKAINMAMRFMRDGSKKRIDRNPSDGTELPRSSETGTH